MALLITSCGVPEPGTDIPSSNIVLTEEVLADGFEIPYAIEVISEDDFLVTERMGAVYRCRMGGKSKISGLPESRVFMTDRYYGGMMDISLHPDFNENRLVYLAYVDTSYTMSVVRFRLTDNSAEDVTKIFSSNQFSIGTRIAWDDSDHYYLSFGVGGDPKPEPGPQDLADPRGKIFRFNDDGSVPDDNPVFPGNVNALPGIWSIGHRDPQGLYFDQESQTLYANEHGPLGGDELGF